MAIGAAGMAVEMWLAGISLLIWAAMPEGGIKSVAFVVATSSLLTSLFIMEFAAGGTNIPHHHDREEEIYLVLDGHGQMVAGGGMDGGAVDGR